MNIIIPDSWLREFLKTKASASTIADCLTSCGPTVDKLNKVPGDFLYEIEITANRVDAMSIYGIAREANAILTQYDIKTKLLPYKTSPVKCKKKLEIKITNNPSLCKRILAVKISNVKLAPSPKWLQERLEKVGQRPLNNAVDISNYIMWEAGHPAHVFDYDKIKENKIIVREAKKGEEIITLDGIKHTLYGGEVVFDNGKGEIIDLPGIMGTKNTFVSEKTKNILLWVESINPEKIRKASMSLGIRSQAAILNEKGVDPELGLSVIEKGVSLFEKIANAKADSELVDIYPVKIKPKKIILDKQFISERLGVDLDENKIKDFLVSLQFKCSWKNGKLSVIPPSFRSDDINIPEDIVEEIARIYGYHKLPSRIPSGALPEKPQNTPFDFENKLKRVMSCLGGYEVYTLSLVPENHLFKNALKLKNPLGSDSVCLRTSFLFSLNQAAEKNKKTNEPFHLFEIGAVYIPKKNSLPDENIMLAGIFYDKSFREAKGVIEKFLFKLNIKAKYIQKDNFMFLPSCGLEILKGNDLLGRLGILEENLIYYEFAVNSLMKNHNPFPKFNPHPKYPPQIEDLTLSLPERTKVGEVISAIKSADKSVAKVLLEDIYNDAFTFRIHYVNPKKTLTDKEVETARNKILEKVKKSHGALIKS